MNDNINYWLDTLDNWSRYQRQRHTMGTNDLANLLAIAGELTKEIHRQQVMADLMKEKD